MKNYRIYLTAVWCALLLCQCANRGSGPQGGPKDETPPSVVKSSPKNGTTGFKGTSITIDFNENISIDNPMQNVVVSPPQESRPSVKAIGRKAVVSFQDTLLPETSYSINFGNSIVDYTEGNALKNYRFLFSTGNTLDSLLIQGKVVDAMTLEPVERITVGIYASETDSTFATTAFDRIGVTDKEGRFTIDGIREGTYSLYAIQDMQGVFHYAQAGAYVAFSDSTVQPYVHIHATIDTLWADTAKTVVDSVITQQYTVFGPAELELRVFKEPSSYKKYTRSTRELRERFNLIFTDALDELPEIQLLDTTVNEPWYIREKNTRKDSLLYWITDSALIARDTLRLALRYPSLGQDGADSLRCDSIRLVFRKKKAVSSGSSGQRNRSGKKNEASDESKSSLPKLSFTHNLQNKLDYFDSIRLVFNEPIVVPDTSTIHLYVQENDSVWLPIRCQLSPDDPDCPMLLRIWPEEETSPDKTYKIQVDSLGIRSLYGKPADRFSKPFQFTREEDYANLFVKPLPTPEHAILELLDDKGTVVEVQRLEDGEAAFYDKKPGNYKLRMYLDENDNGQWDTGSIKDRRQPETMYYCPKTYNLRANWDVEETWEYQATPSDKDNRPLDKRKSR
ncbi:MAG: Ig-like domain-containing protein [Paludibacteraceae bacterium]|nr:Ig-like domain-containing protein [Paludibacteraceae bacterium]